MYNAIMQKIIDLLKNLGILKVGGGTAVGSSDKLIDLSVSDYGRLGAKKKSSPKKKTKKKSSRKEDFSLQSIERKTWITWGVIFLLLLLIFNFWTAFWVLLWKFSFIYLGKSSKFADLTSKSLLGIKIAVSVILFFFIIVAIPSSETGDEFSDNSDAESITIEESVEQDNVYKFLKEIEAETGIEFSPVEEEKDLTWPAERVKLNLNYPKSMTAKDMDADDFIALTQFFSNRGATSGGIGFTYTADSGSGYLIQDQNSKYSGIMCIVNNYGYGLNIACGGGPGFTE